MNRSYAGLWMRVLAFALDYLIIAAYLVLLVAVSAVVNSAFPVVPATLFANSVSSHITSFLLVILPVALYFALLESSSSQATWGKRKMGLRVIRTDGARLSRTRALSRTVLKFIPWELTHTLIWQIRFAPQEPAPIVSAGFVLVWLLVGANIVSLMMSKTHQTLYDRLAETYVVAEKDG